VCKIVGLETHNSSLGYPEEEKRQEERRTQYAAQRKIKKSTSISDELSVRLHSGRKEQPQKAQTASGRERAEKRRHKLHTLTKPAILGFLSFEHNVFVPRYPTIKSAGEGLEAQADEFVGRV